MRIDTFPFMYNKVLELHFVVPRAVWLCFWLCFEMVARGVAGSHADTISFCNANYRLKYFTSVRTAKHVKIDGSWYALLSDCAVEKAVRNRKGQARLLVLVNGAVEM